MKKPEKLKIKKDLEDFNYGIQEGYNKAIDDYEKFLPSEEEIYQLLKNWIVESKSLTKEMGMYGTDDEERRHLAKAIYNRIHKEGG